MCRAPLGCAQWVLPRHMQAPDKPPFFVYSCRMAYLYGRTDFVSVFDCTVNLVLECTEMKLGAHLFTYQYSLLSSIYFALDCAGNATQNLLIT